MTARDDGETSHAFFHGRYDLLVERGSSQSLFALWLETSVGIFVFRPRKKKEAPRTAFLKRNFL